MAVTIQQAGAVFHESLVAACERLRDEVLAWTEMVKDEPPEWWDEDEK